MHDDTVTNKLSLLRNTARAWHTREISAGQVPTTATITDRLTIDIG